MESVEPEMPIKKKDMAPLVKRHLLPLLGDGWSVYRGETVYRIDDSGLLLQMVSINRSQQLSRFVPSYAINLIALAIDPGVSLLGSRLKDRRGGDLWLEWSENSKELAAVVFAELQRQANPSIGIPLNLAEAADCVSRYHISKTNFYGLWSLGVLKGLLGQLEEAAKFLDAAEKPIRRYIASYERDGETAPAWHYEYLQGIGEYRKRLHDTAEFRTFCEVETINNRKKLKF